MIQYQPNKEVKIPRKSKMLPVINAGDIILLNRTSENLFTVMFGRENDNSLNGFHVNNIDSVDALIAALKDVKGLMKKKTKQPTR